MNGRELHRALDRLSLSPHQFAKICGTEHVRQIYARVREDRRADAEVPGPIYALVRCLQSISREDWPIDVPARNPRKGGRRIRVTATITPTTGRPDLVSEMGRLLELTV